MRNYDEEEVGILNAEPWQTDLLKLNPSYVHWGPHEDYMWKEKDGWDSRIISESWAKFGPWTLDEYNECVNFYFSVDRASKECPCCGGNGYHPKAQNVVNTFYSHMNPQGEHWNDKITEDEVKALLDAGRLHDFARDGKLPIAAQVNASQGRGFMGHDAINRYILIEARLDRLGLPKTCEDCDGRGYVFTAPSAHVSLTLWMLHPRKGCSRGVEVSRVEKDDLPAIFEWLHEAAKRNAERFSLLPPNK